MVLEDIKLGQWTRPEWEVHVGRYTPGKPDDPTGHKVSLDLGGHGLGHRYVRVDPATVTEYWWVCPPELRQRLLLAFAPADRPYLVVGLRRVYVGELGYSPGGDRAGSGWDSWGEVESDPPSGWLVKSHRVTLVELAYDLSGVRTWSLPELMEAER